MSSSKFCRIPDHVHASWAAALVALKDSRDFSQGEPRFQFCCGYLQALPDSRSLDDYFGRILMVELQKILIEHLNRFNLRT